MAKLAANLDAEVRVVVVTGDGPSSSAGIDRAMLTRDGIAGEIPLMDAAAQGPVALAEAIAPLRRGFAGWSDVSAAVIAAVQGAAIGAGFQLALAADVRLVADDVQFAMRETSLGLAPDLGGTRPLANLVGYSTALEICLTGRPFGAAETAASGLAVAAVPTA